MNKPIQLTLDLHYEPRILADRSNFEQKGSKIMDIFPKIAEDSLTEMNAMVSAIPYNQRGIMLKPIVMNGNVCGKMMAAFPEYAQVRSDRRVSLVVDGTVILFKKLDEKHKPNHFETLNSTALVSNRKPKNKNEGSIIWMGYTTSSDWRTITGAYVICLDHNGQLKWGIDLFGRLDSPSIDIVEPIIPTAPVLKST